MIHTQTQTSTSIKVEADIKDVKPMFRKTLPLDLGKTVILNNKLP